MWATKLGEMAGVKVPLIAMHHAYVVTERIEGIQVGTQKNKNLQKKHNTPDVCSLLKAFQSEPLGKDATS